MQNEFLREVADWFGDVKAPDLKEKVDQHYKFIEDDVPLEENSRKLFGFMLFSYSMNKGPVVFQEVQQTAELIGVSKEMEAYAKEWLDHSLVKKQQHGH